MRYGDRLRRIVNATTRKWEQHLRVIRRRKGQDYNPNRIRLLRDRPQGRVYILINPNDPANSADMLIFRWLDNFHYCKLVEDDNA